MYLTAEKPSYLFS